MKLTDPAIVELTERGAAQGADVFLQLRKMPLAADYAAFAAALRAPVLVPLPGAVYTCGFPADVIEEPRRTYRSADNAVYYADVRTLMADEAPAIFERTGVREIVVPFYECAALAEYGYKMSYGNLSNLRAALPYGVHITGVSRGDLLSPEIFEAFGTAEYVLAGEEPENPIDAVRAENERKALFLTAELCEKYPLRRIAALCPTRTRALELHTFLTRRGNAPVLLHGGRTREENETALRRFAEGKTNLLIATKSLLGAQPFLRADKVFYYGLPYSVSHAARLSSFCDAGKITCVYCGADADLDRKLSAGFAAALGLCGGAFAETREQMLREALAAAEESAGS